MSEFRALVRREWRCHYVSFLVATGIACLVAFHDVVWVRAVSESSEWSYRYVFDLSSWPSFPLMREPLLSGLYSISILYALYLGIGQISFDSFRGLESFLVHRPVSRLRIVTAKLFTGALLLLGAILPAFFMRVVFTAMPFGHAEPFRWEMAYPGVCNIFAGLALYFAAFWAAAGQGRERATGIFAILPAWGVGVILTLKFSDPWTAEHLVTAVLLVVIGGAITAYCRRRAQ